MGRFRFLFMHTSLCNTREKLETTVVLNGRVTGGWGGGGKQGVLWAMRMRKTKSRTTVIPGRNCKQ